MVVGGGPTGLLLAGELRLAGADPLVLEAADGPARARSLGMRGLTEPLVEAQQEKFGQLVVDSDDGDHVRGLLRMLRENRARGHFGGPALVEEPRRHRRAVPAQAAPDRGDPRRLATGLGVRIRLGCAVVDVVEGDSAVQAVLADGEVVRAAYLVGCDGGRSTVRKRAGIEFPGTPATMTGRTAVAELADPGAIASSRHGPNGLVSLSLVPGRSARSSSTAARKTGCEPVTAAEMEASIRRVTGVDATLTSMEVGIRYSDHTRQAATCRKGRVFLA